MKNILLTLFLITTALLTQDIKAKENIPMGMRRGSYLLNFTFPTDEEYSKVKSKDDYYQYIRSLLDSDKIYDSLLRYHVRLLGIGLNQDVIKELYSDSIDGKSSKIAKLKCSQTQGKIQCDWVDNTGTCSQKQPTVPFWYEKVSVWVCPSVTSICGSDLKKCFIQWSNPLEAKEIEFGASEIYDSQVAIIRSLSRQAAGIATALIQENYPYTQILHPQVTAIDAPIVNLIHQPHHFDFEKLHIPNELKSQVEKEEDIPLKFKLVIMDQRPEQGGILSTIGGLRRFEKNRSRANWIYNKLLCRKFTDSLPVVFPQDPGNLQTTPGCMGCHATLDPLSYFFSTWGEGANLYGDNQSTRDSTFIGKTGQGLTDLSQIIKDEEGFATCTVQNVWEWMMGRGFELKEASLRDILKDYFISTRYNFKELIYAIATHPNFFVDERSDGLVGQPLESPALGKVPTQTLAPCPTGITFSKDIQSKITLCTACHNSSQSARQPLETEAQWRDLRSTIIPIMSSGSMPPGQLGPPVAGSGSVFDLKEAVRCWNVP